MAKMTIEGSFVALITPFNEDGSVDFGAFRTLLRFQEDHGTAAVLFMGSTGEPTMLSQEERRRLFDHDLTSYDAALREVKRYEAEVVP